MSRGKHVRLSEARKEGKLARFAKEHPAIGDREKFDALLKAWPLERSQEQGEHQSLAVPPAPTVFGA